MYLIDVETFAVEEHTAPVPKYAILSHTWGDEEVSFKDMGDLSVATRKNGFAKIRRTCEQAKRDRIGYAWIDTCCIDKSSSAELSEAINSMFKWYRDASACYAYLSDLNNSTGTDRLEACRWFTRGWTLQELLAPREVSFFDGRWECLGSRRDLAFKLSAITRVDIDTLVGVKALSETPAAKKMSWAATRKTSRVEDIAYCLFGLFDIHLPIIYGEGPKAYLRLQEEIIRASRDLTLFAWTSESPGPTTSQYRGAFARHPDEFAGCHRLEQSITHTHFTGDISMDSNGLRIKGLQLYRRSKMPGLLLPLQCSVPSKLDDTEQGILLRKTMRGYVRLFPHVLRSLNSKWSPVEVDADFHIARDVDPSSERNITADSESTVKVTFLATRRAIKGITPAYMIPRELWDSSREVFLTKGLSRFSAEMGIIARISDDSSKVFDVSVQFGYNHLNDDEAPWASTKFLKEKEAWFRMKWLADTFGEAHVLSRVTRPNREKRQDSVPLSNGQSLRVSASITGDLGTRDKTQLELEVKFEVLGPNGESSDQPLVRFM